MKEKVEISAFRYILEEKERSKKKLKVVKYTSLKIQPYMNSKDLTMKEKIFLFSLRSGCHPAKLNFRNMNKNNLICSLKCNSEESQAHIFESCNQFWTNLVSSIYQSFAIYLEP